MTRSCIKICLLAVISLFAGVIWQGAAYAAMPDILPLGSITVGMQNPSRVAVDSAGNLYVANIGNDKIVKFDKYGSQVADIHFVDTDSAVLSGQGLAVTLNGSAIYVSMGNRVAVLGADGAFLSYLGSGLGEFQDAGVIAVNKHGDVIVSDNDTRQVKVFPAGVETTAFLLTDVSFTGVTSIAVDPVSDNIYVGDSFFDNTLTRQLYVFSPSGSLLPQFQMAAATDFGSTPLNTFGGMAFDELGRLYVGDSAGGNIHVVELPVSYLGEYDNQGTTLRPQSIAYDAGTKRLFVTWLSSRVDIFGIDGGVTPIASNTPPTVPATVTFGELSSVSPDLVFNNSTDDDGDSLDYNVQVVDAVGALVTNFTVTEVAGSTETSVNVSLTENAFYSWQVQADDGSAVSAWSALKPIYINAVEEYPTAPELTDFLSGEAAGSDAVLIWNGSTDADPSSSVSYRVEILEGTAPVASFSIDVGTSASFADFSSVLSPSTTYVWKVVAVDNTGLETSSAVNGSFLFQTSVLTVSSNVSGAKVYLGGHHGYAGRLLGTAPVEVRDLVNGKYSVVVEAAGFEPYFETVEVAADTQAVVVADHKAARLATSFAVHDLNLAGLAVSGADVAPIVADLNQDNVLDLLLADNGYLKLYVGSLTQGPQVNDSIENLSLNQAVGSAPAQNRVVFSSAAQQLAIPQISGAAPCLVDWNNDDQFDLLVGGADGTVKLFLGQGGLNFSAAGDIWMNASAQQVIPAIADIDNDGDKDLVVASADKLFLVVNDGSDAAPLLNSQSSVTIPANAVPMFTDWNADGTRDLMLLSQGELFLTVINNGVAAMTSTGLTVLGAQSVFALNFAGSNYADLVYGVVSPDGTETLVVANGQQGGFAPAYKEALLAKLAEVELAVSTQDSGLIGKVANIASRIGRGKYASAQKKAEQLVGMLGATTPAGIAVNGLANILN